MINADSPLLNLHKFFNTPPKEEGEYLGIKWLHDLVFYIQLDNLSLLDNEELCIKFDLQKTNNGYLVHPQTCIKEYIHDKQYYFQIIQKIIDTSYDIGGSKFLEAQRNIEKLLRS